MRRAQRKDFFREIKNSLNRFLSILLMVALGVAFYTGVRASEPDMRKTADSLYDETKLMDVRVLGTLGLTEADVAAVREIEGVSVAEGAYTAELFAECNGSAYVASVFSAGQALNQIAVTEGRLPERPEECLVDAWFASTLGLSIGDTVRFTDENGETPSSLAAPLHTVVGFGDYSYYLSWDRGTASIGNGETDAFFVLSPSGFEQEAYSALYLRVAGAEELLCYSEDYETLVEQVKERLEALAPERNAARYQSLVSDAEAELAEGEAELAEARQALAEGEQELADAKETLTKTEQELADGKQALIEGEQQLLEARQTLEENSRKLAAGWAELEEQEAALAAAEEALAAQRQQLEAGMAAAGGVTPELTAMEAVLTQTESELRLADTQLVEARQTLAAQEEALAAGEETIAEKEAELLTARDTYERGLAEYEEGLQTYTEAEIRFAEERADAETQLADGEAELSEAREALSSLEVPEWYVLDRNTIQSYVEFGMDAERIGAIGKVFPAIFFLVAALVSLTTMTRMVEEGRTQIGTYQALGYSKLSIASKYLLYALLASVIGGLAGILVGSNLLPQVIIRAYAILYANLPAPLTPIDWRLSLTALGIAVACTTLATLAACYKELLATPATLMRPAAPKQGKRVFLERVQPIWRRLSFSKKAAVRNLLRYKKRFLMTVFGIGACMALLIVGFGLRDSIQEIVKNQYRTVWTYHCYLSVEETEAQGRSELAEMTMSEQTIVEEQLFVYLSAMDITANGMTKSANLFVPETLDQIDDFIVLQDRVSKERYHMTDEGIVLSEKAAQLLSVSVGDEILLKESETISHAVTVTAITENYLYHYVYMTPALYLRLFGTQPDYNQLFLRTNTREEAQLHALADTLLRQESVSSFVSIEDLQVRVSDMMKSLDLVVWVLIVAAGLLAFVVLYNLNNISIIERRREMATLKVLGFYDLEVAGYCYRENVVLTLIGILIGFGLGAVLHQFVIRTCEIDMIMFGRQVSGVSYLLSVLLTLLFAGIINFSMYFKLKKIDMVESLKSVE